VTATHRLPVLLAGLALLPVMLGAWWALGTRLVSGGVADGANTPTRLRVASIVREDWPGRPWLAKPLVAAQLAMGRSPGGDAVVGREGFLFYAKSGDRNLDSIRRLPWGEGEAARLAAWFADNAATCRRHGAAYLVVFTPDKDDIYPEQLPAWLDHGKRPRRVEILLPLLRAVGVAVLDTTAAVRAERLRHGRGPTAPPLFQRYDTHWSDLGALAAAEAIIDHLAAAGGSTASRLARPGRPTLTMQRQPGGDLARFVGGSRHGLLEWLPCTSCDARPDEGVISKAPAQATPGQGGLRVLMFRDSFSARILPFLTPAFGSTWPFWLMGVREAYVANARPELVIHQIAVRRLHEPRFLAVALEGAPE
jgi:hypothetical protein